MVAMSTESELKEAFADEIREKQYFCSSFKHIFSCALDAIKFWTFCGLHFPYVINDLGNGNGGNFKIDFEPQFAMAILGELTKAPTEQLPKDNNGYEAKLRAKFIGELKLKEFSCKRFSQEFNSVKSAINFWSFCGLHLPFTLEKSTTCIYGANTYDRFQIKFDEKYGNIILSHLSQAPPPDAWWTPIWNLWQSFIDDIKNTPPSNPYD